MIPARFVAGATLTLAAGSVTAGSLPPQGCDRRHDLSATEQDRLLRFAAVIRQTLTESGAQVALIARSGTDLSRFGLRYSHAAIALASGLDSPWAVRQLYYACNEGAPRLFDQGLAGFVAGSDDAALGYVSLLLLPADAAPALAEAALNKPTALSLVAPRYSANAWPFSTRYQNCNQWVAELIAAAHSPAAPSGAVREDAQAWLKREGYAPVPVRASPLMMLAGRFVPWLHFDDQPDELLAQNQVQTSLPESLETLAQQRWPGSRHVELCHGPQGVVKRAGGSALAAGCVPQAGDQVTALD